MNKRVNDLEFYKNEFIDKFIKVFPTIYTKTELKGILDKNVFSIGKLKI